MKKEWWHPLKWVEFALEAVWGVLKGIWDAILSVFGIYPKAPRGGHENLKIEDVDAAASAEAYKQHLANLLTAEMTPAEVVLAYAGAGAMDRPTVDLSRLSAEEQDWLVGLSDSDLILLAASGKTACERSLRAKMAIPDLSKLRAEKAPVEEPRALVVPSKEDLVRARYAEVVRGLHLTNKPVSRG